MFQVGSHRRQHNLGELTRDLDELAGNCMAPTIRQLREIVGERSFGPFLTIPAIIEMSPIGGIPGVPSIIAVIISFFAIQILFGQRHLWLPNWLEEKTVNGPKFKAGLEKIAPASRWIDRLIKPRFEWATNPPFLQSLAAVTILLCATVPPLELVPFASTLPMATIALIGLALTARDGLLASAALLFTAATAYAAYNALM